MTNPIDDYRSKLTPDEAKIGTNLEAAIAKHLPEAEGKVWHGHPVWFIAGNPVVGYSKKKAGIEVLFWSGQSFQTEGLRPIGRFKAAAFAVTTETLIDQTPFVAWLGEAKAIQWDYANLPKKRALEKLTDFPR